MTEVLVSIILHLVKEEAESVADYLESNGINRTRLSIISYGEENPVDASSNEAAFGQKTEG